MLRTSTSIALKQFHARATTPINFQSVRFFRSTVATAAAHGGKLKGQAPPSSRRPVEETNLEQNPHLKHNKEGEKGRKKAAPSVSNAADDPKLPSHKVKSDKPSKAGSNGKRGLHWSAVRADDAAGKSASGDGHSADSYFKDVDTNEPTGTTYSVGGDDATKAHRPHEQYADPNKQYATVSSEEPYQPSTNGGGKKEENLRYGGKEKDAEKGTSHSKESAAEGNAGGRKPEGR